MGTTRHQDLLEAQETLETAIERAFYNQSIMPDEVERTVQTIHTLSQTLLNINTINIITKQ